MSHQNVCQNRDIKIANISFENISQFKYLGTTVTNQNLIQEEIKRILNSGNASCHSVQNLLSSYLLLKNVKIRIYQTIILPVVLYGCETWSLTLRDEHRLRVFENRVLRKLVNSELNLRLPWIAGKRTSCLTSRGLSRCDQLHRVSEEGRVIPNETYCTYYCAFIQVRHANFLFYMIK
jgi:hypothetical protein